MRDGAGVQKKTSIMYRMNDITTYFCVSCKKILASRLDGRKFGRGWTCSDCHARLTKELQDLRATIEKQAVR